MNMTGNTVAVPPTGCEGTDCRTNGDRPPEPACRGLRLCRGCLRRLVLRLKELPVQYEELEHFLACHPGEGIRERTTGGPLPGLPFNEAAADVRADIVTTLGSWCGLVREELGLSAPHREAGAMARFLVRYAAWLAAHPSACDATGEVARLVKAARQVSRSEPLRRVRLGPCVHDGCTGRLVAAFRSHDPGSCTSIRCDTDPQHTWPADLWTELRRAMGSSGADAERWLSAGDIAQLYSTTTGTVYRLASEQRWCRRSRAGRTYYAETDVHECFARRRAAQAGEAVGSDLTHLHLTSS